MSRGVLLPVTLFVVSAFFSVMSLHAAWASIIVGLALCAYSFVWTRRARAAPGSAPQTTFAASRSMRAGVALVVAPVLTVLLVLAAMSGLFGRH
ncbi:hypothetical protein DWG20_09130 [Crenobacter cavernae]|uniref:Uncharacterized protein n=1 Tax=Crenobacter cavernae TaxID=2290923 RepID=A0A345Y6P0_9NEIS|nr:hypothetical protein DWG20_09130 [Crenobacter cavernae]